MSSFWHISDLHIRAGFYDDIRYAIDLLAEIIRKNYQQQNLLVIAGDVFENKTKVSSSDLECFHQIIQKLSFVKILIIPGNHDISSPDQPDLVSAALLNKYQHVYLFNKSGTYQISDFNVDFHILLPNTDYTGFFQMTPGRINAAIMHEPIRGCKLYGSITIDTQARFTIKDLEVFDFVMLGDIHQPQYLGKTQKIAYSGSLVQKNKAEGLLHGYIRWQINIKDVTSSFHHLPLYAAYVLLFAEDNVVNYPDHSLFVKAKYVELRYSNCDIDKIMQEIHNKYGRLDNIVHIDKKEEVIIENVMQVDNLHSMLETGLADNPHKDKILGIHQQLYNTISDELGAIKQKWRLNFLSWSNIFCYGENNHIDFTKLTGVVSLIGKNKTGKSSILDILVFALYNELLRGDRKSIIRTGASSYKIACGFSNADAEYIIQREGKNNAGNQINIFKLLEKKNNEWKDITMPEIFSTYDLVYKLIGNYQDLVNINIALQENILIVNKKPDEQVAEFRKYFGLDKLERIEIIVRDKIKELKQIKKNKKTDLEKSGLADIINDDDLDFKIKSLNEEIDRNIIEIKRLNEHKDNLNKKLFPIKQTLEECLTQIANIATNNYTKDFLFNEITNMQQHMPDIIKSFDQEINKYHIKKVDAAKKSKPAPQEEEIINIISEISTIGQKYEKGVQELQNKKDELQKKITPVKIITIPAVNLKTIKEYDELLNKNTYQEESVRQLEKEITLLEAKSDNITEKLKNLIEIDEKQENEKQEKQEKIEEIEKIEDIRQKLTNFPKFILDIKITSDKKTLQEKLIRYEKQYLNLYYLIELKSNLAGKFNLLELDPEKIDRFTKLEKDLQILQKYSFVKGTTELKLNLGLKNTLVEYQKLAEFKQILDKISKGYDQELNAVLKFEDNCECCKSNKNILHSNITYMMNVINDMYYYKTMEMIELSYYLMHATKNQLMRIEYDEINAIYTYLYKKELAQEISLLKTEKDNVAIKLTEKINMKKQQLLEKEKQHEYKSCINYLKYAKIQKRNDEINKIIQEIESDLQILISERDTNINILGNNLTKLQNEKAKFLQDQETNINAELAEIDKNLDRIVKKRDTNIKKFNQEIQNFQNEIKNIENWEELQERKKKLEFNSSVNKKLELVETELDRLTKIQNKTMMQVKEYQINLSKITFYKSLQQEIIKVDEEKQIYEEYLKRINMKTGIPYSILSKSCHQLESDMNDMLNTITDFKIKLQFDPKKFKIFIQPHNIPAEQGSGFQKFVIDLVLRICLCKNHPNLPTFLIIDEGFGCMDKTHLDNTKELFHLLDLTKKFDYIIVISHLEELQTVTSKKITIEQKDNYSFIHIGTEVFIPESEPKPISDTVITIVDGKNFCHICNKTLLRTSPERHLNTKTHETALNIFNRKNKNK